MADGKYNIEIAVNAQLEAVNEVKEAVKGIRGDVEKLANSTSNLDKISTGAMLNIGERITNLAAKAPGFFLSTIKAFGEQELATQKLASALRAQGASVSEVLPIMQQLASRMQSITTYGDEQVLAMQAMASSMGVSGEQMDSVVKSAIGLATALNMDVVTATKAASAAIQGKTSMLSEFIPSLEKCKTEEEKLAKVQELSRSGFSQAEAAAQTLEGKLKQAANAWGDLQEVVGEAFAPTVKAAAEILKSVCELLAENATFTKLLTIALTSCAVGFAFTKVGGLLNVAKMFKSVSSATQLATVSMHGLNAAIKANPIGLIAGIATTAITGIMSLADYLGNLKSAEEEEAEAQEQAEEARRKAAQETREAEQIVADYEQSLRKSSETSAQTAANAEALAREIEKMQAAYEKAEGAEKKKLALELVANKKQLNELESAYIEKLKTENEEAMKSESLKLASRLHSIEVNLALDRKRGLKDSESFYQKLIAQTKESQKLLELERQYYSSRADSVKSAKEENDLRLVAKKYAKDCVEIERQQSELEKQSDDLKKVADEIHSGMLTNQSDLELEILRTRANGNEIGARELEQRLEISRLASQIFENTRREGMSRDELKKLESEAYRQAEDRYNLEKSVTDEIQRQNLAKNAQAKIEDILITNKIEQLKAEGKLAAARELENEREIRRTLAGLEGVSAEDKKFIAKTMRNTNSLRDSSAQSGAAAYSAASPASGGGAGAISGGDSGSSSGPKPPERPGSVSKKSAALYDEWKASGGERGTGLNWNDFRESRQRPKAPASQRNAGLTQQAGNFLDATSLRAANMAGLKVGQGAIGEAVAQTQSAQAAPAASTQNKQSDKAALPALNNKLNSMGAEPKQSSSSSSSDEAIVSNMQSILASLDSIKSTVTSLVEKKDD